MSSAPAVAYVDSSALVKLAIPEPESDALRAELERWERHVSSALARVELVRACARVDVKARRIAEQIVNALDLIALDDRVLEDASLLGPLDLRSLDAIHLASALLLGDALGVAIAYDDRLVEAMSAAGIPTATPH
ncbi:MAG: type II toxin-antitoxin system VapC family toxin [Gaiellaceae bacterium]